MIFQSVYYIYIILYSIVLNLISAWALFVAVMSNHIVTYWYSFVFSNSLLIHITLIQFCATITHDFKSRTYSEFIVDWVVSTTLPQCRKSPKAASFWAIVATVWLLHVIIRRQSHSTCIALLHIYVFAIHLLHSQCIRTIWLKSVLIKLTSQDFVVLEFTYITPSILQVAKSVHWVSVIHRDEARFDSITMVWPSNW